MPKPWEEYAGTGTESSVDEAPKQGPWTEYTADTDTPEQKAEKERAKRLREADPAELRKIHFGQNLPESQKERSITGEVLSGAVKGTAELMDSVKHLPELAYGLATKPAAVGTALVKGVVETPKRVFKSLATGTPEEVGKVLPEVAGAVVPAAQLTAGAGSLAKAGVQAVAGPAANRIVRSLIKPNKSELMFSKDPAGAILKEGIVGNSLEGLGANVQGKIDDYLGRVDTQLATSKKTVPVNEITALLDNEVARLKGSIGVGNKEGLLGRIEEIQNEVLTRFQGKSEISLPEVHALRREIDDTILRFTADAVEQNANKSKFELRQGINRLIETREPGVQAVNRRVSELLGAKDAIQRQVQRGENSNLLGAGNTLAGTAGAIGGTILGGAPGGIVGAAGAAALRGAAGSTAVKTRVAKFLEGISGAGAAVDPAQAAAAGFRLSAEEMNVVQKLADEYMTAKGGKLPKHQMAEVKEELSKKLADFYETAKHEPDNPVVQASYKNLIDETVEQWNAIHEAGYKLEPWTQAGEPYANSAAMIADVRGNKHLYYKPSESAFGTGGEGAQQLMMQQTPLGVPANDVFRAVHDFFGHAKEANQFGPKGEFNAWLVHSDMYSPEAQGALAAETLAQNSVVNFGKAMRGPEGQILKKGDPGFLGPTERPFAEQKNIVVPEELRAEARSQRPGFRENRGIPGTLDKGNYMMDNKGQIHRLAADETHRQWIERNFSDPKSPMLQKYQDFDRALDAGYVRARVQGGNLIIEASQNNPNWVRDIKKLAEQAGPDQPVYIDTFQNGNLKQFHFDDPAEFREWINKGAPARRTEGVQAFRMDKGRDNIIRQFEEREAAKNAPKAPVQIKGSTVEAVDREVAAQDMVEAWVDEFKTGAPTKTKGTNYETGRRVYEGRNFGDVPGLDRVGAGDAAIVRALNTRQGPVWDKIETAAREQVEIDLGRAGKGEGFVPDELPPDALDFPFRESKGSPSVGGGSFKEENFNLPGEVDRTYRGPERRQLKRAEGTIREEEFEFPPEVKKVRTKEIQPDGVIGYKPKHGKIVLDDKMMDSIGDNIGASYLNGLQVFAGTSPSGQEAVGRAFIQQLKKEYPKQFAMVPAGKPLTIQRVSGTQAYKDIARHEGTHATVNEVVKMDLSDVLDFGKFSSEGRKAWQKAALKKQHYNIKDRPDEVIAELATGNPSRLGLGREEGLQLLHDMLEQLGEKFGPEGMEKVMSRFAPRFKNRPYDAMGGKGPKIGDRSKQAGTRLSEDEPTWYNTAKARLEEIGKQHDIPLETLAGVAAALSPNNRWAQNVTDVKKWAAAFKAGTLNKMSSAGTFGRNREKAFRIMNGESPETVLSGPKVKAFYKALLGEGDDPVIDFHMANILRGEGYKTTKETKSISAKEYKELADQLLAEATAKGMKPADLQAEKWIEHRDRGQKSLFPPKGGK